jgi:hypothetical protein
LARLEFERLIVELFGFIGISLALTLEHSWIEKNVKL